MTQPKAASLSSALFARKGDASPASLVISELEARGTPAERQPDAVPANDMPVFSLIEGRNEESAPHDAAEAKEPAEGDDEAPPAASLERVDPPRARARREAPDGADRREDTSDVAEQIPEGPEQRGAKPEASQEPAQAALQIKAKAIGFSKELAEQLSWPVGAGLAVLGVLIGVVLYALIATDDPASPQPASLAPEAVMQATPEEVADEPAASTLDAASGEQAPAEPEQPAAGGAATESRAFFDIVRIEPDGESLLAGRAPPFSEWIVLNNGAPIGSITADAVGQWVLMPGADIVPGDNQFSLVPKLEQGGFTMPPPLDAEEPQPQPLEEGSADPGTFTPSAPPSSAATESPVGQAETAALPTDGEAAATPVPTRKPTPPAASGERVYEIQVASVRVLADAEREMARLLDAYGTILSPVELHVDQADLAEDGVFFRVRGGPIATLSDARALCRQLREGGQDCLVVLN